MMGYGGIPPAPASFPIPGHSSGRPRSFRGADGFVRLVLLMRMDQFFGAKMNSWTKVMRFPCPPACFTLGLTVTHRSHPNRDDNLKVQPGPHERTKDGTCHDIDGHRIGD